MAGKGLDLCTIKTCHGVRTSVVKLRYRTKALLACRVPYLESHSRGSIDIHHSLGEKGCAYRRLSRRRRKGILNITVHERRLADALATEYHNLGLQAIRHVFVCALRLRLCAEGRGLSVKQIVEICCAKAGECRRTGAGADVLASGECRRYCDL